MKQSKIVALACGTVLAVAATFMLPLQHVSAQQTTTNPKKPTIRPASDPPVCPPTEPDCPYQ